MSLRLEHKSTKHGPRPASVVHVTRPGSAEPTQGSVFPCTSQTPVKPFPAPESVPVQTGAVSKNSVTWQWLGSMTCTLCCSPGRELHRSLATITLGLPVQPP